MITWSDGSGNFSVSFFPKRSKRPPYLLRVAFNYAKTGYLPFWLKVLINIRFGRFKTPSGVDYDGFKVSFKW